MKKTGRLISFLCCVAAIALLVGIYFAKRMYSTAYIITGILCFAVAVTAIMVSVMIYIRYYNKKYK